MSFLRNCRTAGVQVRGFASSASLRVGPESPNFIDVPRTIQPELPSKRRVKGTLPVPRELFPARRTDKPSKAYIKDATPLPTNQTPIDPNDPHAEYIESKRHMADMRRRNLRQGLKELHWRKRRTDWSMMERSLEKQRRREEIFQQPERLDESLTRPSVVQDMQPTRTAVLPDPDREIRLAESRARTEVVNAQKKMEREEALQTLYMNARNFITTEEQLAAEIERVFPDGYNPEFTNDTFQGENIWNKGAPTSVQSIVNDSRRNEVARWDTIQDRVKKLGEELTGGKL
ncbi:hypothetical protein SI65_00626 [Aspergillus cristatus]|uniref:Uncharacterized protein n=1 Tax=Aspergillus cristatus TaxID=573508 RepID=A0A1E3BQ79_ASPCR|nr:hypothetical protein SI65_00626 [Aspergillus cristatus]